MWDSWFAWLMLSTTFLVVSSIDLAIVIVAHSSMHLIPLTSMIWLRLYANRFDWYFLLGNLMLPLAPRWCLVSVVLGNSNVVNILGRAMIYIHNIGHISILFSLLLLYKLLVIEYFCVLLCDYYCFPRFSLQKCWDTVALSNALQIFICFFRVLS